MTPNMNINNGKSNEIAIAVEVNELNSAIFTSYFLST